ncbi:MAG: hypothetical protein EHM44_07480 [Ignavibacteriales bacterium]|jgi:hypothetical protein|nr:MAG: hypothetical protein EHM44_07480 [Ignavibacteriales bacterium]
MKTLFLLIVSIILISTSFSQVTPEAFVGMLPAIPGNACLDQLAVKNAFFNKIDSISELIENERSRRDEEIDANSDVYEKQAMDKIAKQYGLSQEELEKLQNEDEMTEEETEALISKALQNSNNLSTEEIKNLEKLNKEGTEAWSEAYGDEKMAEIQSDPEKNQEEQLKNKNTYELGTLQKHILDSLKAVESKFAQQFAEIDKDPEAKIMIKNIDEWELEALALMGEGNNAKAIALQEKINAEKEKYCNKYTPAYLDVLKRYDSYTKSCLPVCYRLEAISAQLTKLQTGVDMKQEPGLVGIGKVADYLGKLRGVYKYNLNKN